MIAIPQPALVLNSADVPPPFIRMWNTGTVTNTRSPNELMSWINTVAGSTSSGRLEALVLNCHGFGQSGQLGYGLAIGTGINAGNVSCFSQIRGKVNKIFITACGAAHIARGHVPGGVGDGHYLIGSIARNANAEVVASTELQVPAPSIPVNHIDSFEGLVAYYSNNGNLVRTVRHPSTYQMLFGGWAQNG